MLEADMIARESSGIVYLPPGAFARKELASFDVLSYGRIWAG